MKVRTLFYVIYTIDTHEKISRVKPDYIKHPKFKVTENEGEFISDCEKPFNHRKYVGIIDAHELLDILKEEYSSTYETMGALTLEFGMLDAISFQFEDQEAWRGAYISLIFDETEEFCKEMDTIPKDQWEIFQKLELWPKTKDIYNKLKEMDGCPSFDDDYKDEEGNEILPYTIELNIRQNFLNINLKD